MSASDTTISNLPNGNLHNVRFNWGQNSWGPDSSGTWTFVQGDRFGRACGRAFTFSGDDFSGGMLDYKDLAETWLVGDCPVYARNCRVKILCQHCLENAVIDFGLDRP